MYPPDTREEKLKEQRKSDSVTTKKNHVKRIFETPKRYLEQPQMRQSITVWEFREVLVKEKSNPTVSSMTLCFGDDLYLQTNRLPLPVVFQNIGVGILFIRNRNFIHLK